MATFVGQMYVRYDGNSKYSNATGDTTVTDRSSDSTTFTLSEALYTSGTLSIRGGFNGTTTVNGELYIAVKTSTITHLFGPAQDASLFPASLSSLTFDTSTFTVCFLAGTQIATPAGELPVESLAVGDLVLTADGRTAPVKWVGVQTVVTLFADPLRSFPIRITAGALGENLPVRDLLVSPDHAPFIDGVLVQAGALVNGTSIVRETAMPERFTYFHVELDDHALILAEGVPAETFVDNVTRRRFDNFAEYARLYGDTGATIAEIELPRIKSTRQLPRALRTRLDAQAAALGTAIAAA
jgi:hypothetical protein